MAIHNFGFSSRRTFLRNVVRLAALLAGVQQLVRPFAAQAQSGAPGFPLPDETVESALKRLFGKRNFQRGEDKIKLELPQIAEDGGNVAITVDSNLPVAGAARLTSVYIISDKNRRPLLAKFLFSPDSGRASVATSVRLATTTGVRAVAEMSDGTLYAVTKHVRVIVSGCDLPPQT